MMQQDDLLPEGLQDCLPAEAARITRAMRASLDALDAHGYDLVRPPLVEFEKSLAGRMASGPNDVSRRRMVRFVDPSSLHPLAVTSVITPPIRRIAATRLARAKQSRRDMGVQC